MSIQCLDGYKPKATQAAVDAFTLKMPPIEDFTEEQRQDVAEGISEAFAVLGEIERQIELTIAAMQAARSVMQ